MTLDEAMKQAILADGDETLEMVRCDVKTLRAIRAMTDDEIIATAQKNGLSDIICLLRRNQLLALVRDLLAGEE